MNLDMKVHPAVVAAVIALTVVALVVKVWGDGKAAQFSGPAQILRAPSGHVYIQVRNQLLEHTAEGQFTRRIDLSEYGVQTLIGGIAFFPDGEILMRRGADTRSFVDNFRAYGRMENTSPIRSEDESTGLARCSLTEIRCVPFGTPTIDFKAAFSAFIDPDSGRIYVSDTSRHSLRVFSMDGKEIAAPAGGFRFPNELLMHESALLVADTNRHRIAVLQPEDDDLGSVQAEIDVVPAEADSRGERWPSHFARVGNRWWVNNMRTDMRNGGIYVFDADWRYIERLQLPDGADPIAILPFGAGALISDWDNDRVHYVDASGELLGDFDSPGVQAVLLRSQERRAYYEAVAWLGITLFILVFAAIFAKAFLLPGDAGTAVSPRSGERMTAPADDWTWFRPAARAVRKIRLAILLAGLALTGLIILLLLTVLIYDQWHFVLRLSWSLAGLIAVAVTVFWMSRTNADTEIGLRGDQIILRDHRGRESRSALSRVVFSDSAIATRDLAVILGTGRHSLYDREQVAERLLPYLGRAKRISELQMQVELIRLRHPNGVLLLIALIALAAVALVYLVRSTM